MKSLYTLLIAGILYCASFGHAQAQCARIDRDTTEVTSSTINITIISYYVYDTGNKLIAIDRKVFNTLVYTDTIYYDAVSGKVDSLVRYNQPSGNRSTDFLKNTWSGGNLVKQVNHYTLTNLNKDTSDYTYTGSTLTGFVQEHYDGSSYTTNIATNITHSGGNMTACDFSNDGSPSLASTIEFDSYSNPFYDLHIYNDPLIWGCQNNVTTAYADVAPGLPYFTYTLTYYSSIGRLASTTRPYNAATASIRYAWDCQTTAVFNPLKPEEVGFKPNPAADGIFRLDNSTAEFYDEIMVSTAEGKVLFSMSNISDSEIILDLSSAKSGLYIATLRNSKGVKVARLVK